MIDILFEIDSIFKKSSEMDVIWRYHHEGHELDGKQLSDFYLKKGRLKPRGAGLCGIPRSKAIALPWEIYLVGFDT